MSSAPRETQVAEYRQGLGFGVSLRITFWSGMTHGGAGLGASRGVGRSATPPRLQLRAAPLMRSHATGLSFPAFVFFFFFPVGRRPSLVVFSPRLLDGMAER